MSTHLLPSFRRQQLVLDFASLLPLLPDGIYLTLSPSNPALWSGVLFVRDRGPYESLIARFTISFPPTYPDVAPLVTFQTDIFHPLIVPLTTYAFSGSWDSAGVSAGDVEGRLPPGAFNLRYGFPHWFEKTGQDSPRSSLDNPPSATIGLGLATSPPTTPRQGSSATSPQFTTRDAPTPTARNERHVQQLAPESSLSNSRDMTLALLAHILSSFTDPTLLDGLPLSSAGNPSAWHAWRSYRGLTHHPPRGRSPASTPTLGSSTPSNRDAERVREERRLQSSPRQPSEWNWDGVFESRVKDGVESSISDATLFGSSAGTSGNIGYGNVGKVGPGQGEGQLRFEKLDTEKLEEIRRDIREGRTLVS